MNTMQKFYFICDMVVSKLRETKENILTIQDDSLRIAFFTPDGITQKISWVLEIRAWDCFEELEYESRPGMIYEDNGKPYLVSEEKWMKSFEEWTNATRKIIPAEVKADA